jgi:hypothetical protein
MKQLNPTCLSEDQDPAPHLGASPAIATDDAWPRAIRSGKPTRDFLQKRKKQYSAKQTNNPGKEQTMKHKMISMICALAVGAAVAQPATAQSAKPASTVSLADLKSQLTLLQDSIASTVNVLQRVKESASNEAALKKAAADFASRFKTLEAQVEAVRKQAVVAKAQSNQHYDSWQKDLTAVQNPRIREKAQDRFAESKEEFAKIIATANEAKDKALPFVSELKDIVLYLEADLSEDAVKSLSNDIWKLGNRSKSVIGSIGDVNEQIDRTIKSLPKK